MDPRNLRHRLEKIAKLLVLIQKHAPKAECSLQDEKGEHGHLVLDFSGSGVSRNKMNVLGTELEDKGYVFTEKPSPWLGLTKYTGRAKDKPTILFTVAITQNRLAINDESPEKPFSFKEAKNA